MHHAGPSGYVANRPPSYVGPSGYGMNRSTLRRTIRLYTSPRAGCPSRAIYDRSVRVQPWTIRPDRGPSSSLRHTVWVRDYPRSTIYDWTIRIYLRTVWPGRGPSGLLCRTVRICVRRAESCAIHTVSTFITTTLWCPTSNTL
jgi:hypothetical protein